MYRRFGKRTLDLLIAVPLLVAVSPVLLILAGAVFCTAGRPVLFRQRRPGLGGRPFEILKLRTMRPLADRGDDVRPDAERLTRLGRWLRRASLDELPELLNVVRGDMSLVGPRPLLMAYLDRYSPEQARRHEVRPGITGWAQIGGRNRLSWEEKFARDVWYVDHLGLALDLKILAVTAWKVAKLEGVSAVGHATMPEFGGSERE